MDSKSLDELRDKYLEIGKLLQSPEWAHFREFLSDRAMYFQAKVNAALDIGDAENAKVYRWLMKDSEALLSAFRKHYQEIGKEIES